MFFNHETAIIVARMKRSVIRGACLNTGPGLRCASSGLHFAIIHRLPQPALDKRVHIAGVTSE